jgi:hypothetical protein
MRNIHRKDPWTLVVMMVTLLLFIGALITKGFTHDLLLEAGVFLVSVKLVIMAYKNRVTADAIQNQLQEIKVMLEKQAKIQLSGKSSEMTGRPNG